MPRPFRRRSFCRRPFRAAPAELTPAHRRGRAAFTLVELLVVIGIVALLIAILLPTLNKARGQAKTVACLSNLKQLAAALTMYATRNNGYVVPSYNMTGYDGVADPLDGWAAILDRDRLAGGSREVGGNVYNCEEVLDLDMGLTGQTGSDPAKPKGFMEWPTLRNGGGGGLSAFTPTTIANLGFEKILRVGYWINADNPIGAQKALTAESSYTSTGAMYYTSSVGYLGTGNVRMRPTRTTMFRRPSNLIALADGVYAGKQASNGLFVADSRIGYRHASGGRPAANAAFADGHAETLPAARFPRAKGAGAPYAPAGAIAPPASDVKAENMVGPTIYARPELVFP